MAQHGITINHNPCTFSTEETSAWRVYLRGVCADFDYYSDQTFNLHTHSSYIALLFPHIETASLPAT